MNSRVLVSIVNWNTREPLRRCLDVLGTRRDIEIVVVDNDSSDGSADMVAAEYPSVHLVRAERNLGFAGGNNLALQHGSGEYVLILNPDVEITPDHLDCLISFLEREKCAAAVSPLLIGPDGAVQTNMYRRFPTLAQVCLFWTIIGPLMHAIPLLRRRVFEHDLRAARPAAVDQLPGGAMLMSCAALRSVGPLDNGYFVWWEDVDWCYRARQLGYTLHVLPQVRCRHLGGASFSGWSYEARVFQFYRAFYRFLAVHRWLVFARRITPLMRADFFIKNLVLHVFRALGLRTARGSRTLRDTRRAITDIMAGMERGEVPEFDSTSPDQPYRTRHIASWQEEKDGGASAVDVVIVNWNGRSWLSACVAALQASTIPIRIIVVDNASTDGSPEHLRKVCPDVELIALERNMGYAGGANIGLRRCTARYAFLMNPDVLVEPDHLEVLRERLDADRSIGAAQGKLYSISAAEFARGSRPRSVLDSAGHLMRRSRMVVDRGQGQSDGPQYDKEASIFSACGAALFLRTSMLRDVAVEGAFFAESFFAYKEDVDLGWRARMRGWDVRYVPRAVAHHARSLPLSSSAWRHLSSDTRRHSWKNHYLLMIRNDRLGDILRSLPFIAGWEFLRLGHALIRDRELFPAYLSAFKGTPAALRERRTVLNRSVVGAELRKWFGSPSIPRDGVVSSQRDPVCR